MTCAVEDCTRPAKSRGWCGTHYERWRKHGDVAFEVTPEQRFWSKVDKTTTPDQCWTWTGAGTTNGYGHLWFAGRFQQAHRVAYQIEVGPIPTGLELDHLCMNRLCVRPTHLEPVTRQENLARSNSLSSIRGRMETCVEGHEFTTGANGRRYCAPCRRARRREKAAIA